MIPTGFVIAPALAPHSPQSAVRSRLPGASQPRLAAWHERAVGGQAEVMLQRACRLAAMVDGAR